MGLHLEALHEDVLDDPESFFLDDLDHLELVAATDVGEGQIAGREMHRAGCRFDHHGGPSFRPRGPKGSRPARAALERGSSLPAMSTVTAPAAAFNEVDWPLYSCDDHLDMWALPLDLWTSRLPAADRERAPAGDRPQRRPDVGRRRLGARHQRLAHQRRARRAGPRRLHRRVAAVETRHATRRHGSRRSVRVGDLRPGRARPAHRRRRVQGRVLARAGTTSPSSSTPTSRRASPVLPVLPTHSPEAAAAELATRRRTRAPRRADVLLRVRLWRSRSGIACGPRRPRPACPSASTSAAA